jgi:hypothetical protein
LSESNSDLKDRTIESLHYVVTSVFGFYFGFRVLDNWVRFKTLKQIIENPEMLEKLENEKLSNIIHEILNVRVETTEKKDKKTKKKDEQQNQ